MGRESYILAAPPENSPPPPRSSPAPAPTALAPGFRFHPTDEELVIYYLKRKVCGKSFRFNAITEVDVYKCEPWDLSDKYSLKSRDQEYYFFSALDRKYGNGARMNRATCQGYWKATGNDRPVKHESRTVGLKKTLVFHSGRAPDGKRTNWVMHEYRIVDEELDRAGVGATQDAFVLCRIFHKSNIGPPSGQRYAPFIEEEWDDDDFTMVIPGMNNREELGANRTSFIGGNSHNTYVERNSHEKYGEGKIIVQDTQGTKRPATISKALDLPEEENEEEENEEEEEEHDLPECKVEKPDDHQPLCLVNREDRFESRPPAPPPPGSDTKQNIPASVDHPRSSTLLMYKRRRHNDANGSASSSSSATTTTTTTTAVSTTTTAAAAAAATTKPQPTTRNFLSALVEYSLLESIETKESAAPAVAVPPELEAANLDSALPPSCIKFIQDLQSEIHQVSIERDTLKFEMMSSQAMINILQSRIDLLSKELSELKGKRRG